MQSPGGVLRSPDMDDAELGHLVDRGWRYALALTRDEDAAGDALQDAWLAMLRAGGEIGPGYLFAAIRSRICDRSRRFGWQVLTAPEDLPEPLAADEAPAPLGQVDNTALHAALARLRPDEREALHLTVVEGWSVERVADHQGRPRGTLLSLIHRARAKLRRTLAATQTERTDHG